MRWLRVRYSVKKLLVKMLLLFIETGVPIIRLKVKEYTKKLLLHLDKYCTCVLYAFFVYFVFLNSVAILLSLTLPLDHFVHVALSWSCLGIFLPYRLDK